MLYLIQKYKISKKLHKLAIITAKDISIPLQVNEIKIKY